MVTEIVRGSGTETYIESTTFDQYGRVFQAFDGGGVKTGLEYQYNANGYVESVIEAKNSAELTTTYYTVLAMDVRGNVTQLHKGAMTVNRQYDPVTGRPLDILTQDAGYQTIQDLAFSFDVLGNLLSRTDRSERAGGGYKNLTETYLYDDLNRLDTVTQNNTLTLDMSYDALGNITAKRAYRPDTGTLDGNADVGTYAYGSRPHAVTSAGGVAYGYDANGSLTSGDGRSIGYGVFNKPTLITRGTRTVHLYYGPNRQRYRRVDDSGQSIQTETHYVGSVEWIYKPGSVVITKRYLDGEAIATTTQSGGSVQQDLHYLLKDHLGSTDLITTAIGDIVQAQSFDAYGMRRYDDDFTALTLASRLNFDTSWTTRGFTGHEGMDPVGLVHMNGRVYDPKLGRFVSGDPFVQDPANTQSFNRYSYVFNNPLSYTDPSGYLSLKEAAGIVVGAVVTYVTFGAAGGFAAANFLQGASAGALAGAAGGFASGAIMTGSVTGAFSGALTGAAFGGLTGGFAGAHQSLFSAKAFLSFGTLGGITSVLHGGKFGHGFASAGFGTLAGAAPFLQGGGFGGQLITRAVVGGTLSEATGGKFANGAAYAAFASLVEISMTRVGRSHTAFKNEVMIDSNVEHPAILVELIVDDTALMPDPNTDVPRLAAFHVAPMSSAANVDYSATGGVDASFSRQRGLEGYVVGGYTTAQFNELAGPAVSVATAPVLGVAGRGAVVGAMAARQFLLSHSGEVRIAVTMVLEANAAAVSHTTQFMMSNAPRALHSVYKPFVSPYRPPSTVPSTLVIP